jgi:hypothetical protein
VILEGLGLHVDAQTPRPRRTSPCSSRT